MRPSVRASVRPRLGAPFKLGVKTDTNVMVPSKTPSKVYVFGPITQFRCRKASIYLSRSTQIDLPPPPCLLPPHPSLLPSPSSLPPLHNTFLAPSCFLLSSSPSSSSSSSSGFLLYEPGHMCHLYIYIHTLVQAER